MEDQPATTTTNVDYEIVKVKEWRRDLDAILQKIKEGQVRKSAYFTRERALCVTKLQEAIMWLGMDLKNLGTPNPYPNSKDPSNTIVEPTADGLKL
jgi:hypothetical protein